MESRAAPATEIDSAAPARRLLLHCPDITLKGRNQDDFQKALVRNVRHVLRRAGLPWPVGSARGRVYVDSTGAAPADVERALGLLEKVAGVSSLGAAEWLRPGALTDASGAFNWAAVEAVVVAQAQAAFVPDATFAIRVNRVDKELPVHSQELGVRLGGAVRERTDWHDVDLKHADLTIHIDAYPDGLFIYPEKRRGIGGLPVGTGGRVLALLSGGIDSPVAGFMMSKRGCTVDLFHMSASHLRNFDPENAVVAQLAAQLSVYGLQSKLYIVPYTYFDLAMSGPQTGYELMLFRRFLMRSAEHLANRIGAHALVTGDSLGQVASQTLENLASASQAVDISILRPLIGMNKQEIIDTARQIGSFETSIQPYKDCCALIGRNPRTRSHHDQLEKMEAERFSDYAALIRQTFEETLCLEYDCGALVNQSTVELR